MQPKMVKLELKFVINEVLIRFDLNTVKWAANLSKDAVQQNIINDYLLDFTN